MTLLKISAMCTNQARRKVTLGVIFNFDSDGEIKITPPVAKNKDILKLKNDNTKMHRSAIRSVSGK